MRFRWVFGALVLVLAVGCTSPAPGGPSNDSTTSSTSTTTTTTVPDPPRAVLRAGESLSSGAQLTSPNGRYRAVMQPDGNFVVYGAGNAVVWSANVQGSKATLRMQTDGNLVIYRPDGVAIWSSSTAPASNAWLQMQDDGNLVIYSPTRGALWGNGTKLATLFVLSAGQTLYSGQSLTSPNGRYRAVMQPDGNFVVYGAGNAVVWSANVQGSKATLRMQTDGNLVIYRPDGVAIWSSSTAPASNAWLQMQDDGNLVMYVPGRSIWGNGRILGGAVGDVYPSPDRDAVDCSVKFGPYSWCINGKDNSSRGFGYRNCTDFVAYVKGLTWSSFRFPAGKGHAAHWNEYASNAGYVLTHSPQVGDIAGWDSRAGGFGHVAIVTAVNGNGTVNVEEYNASVKGGYGTSPGVTAEWYLHKT